MSEFDKLKDDAEQYAQKHPEQVEKAEDAVEKKLGFPGQGQQGQDQQGQGSQDPGTGTGAAGPAGQEGSQDSAGQGQ